MTIPITAKVPSKALEIKAKVATQKAGILGERSQVIAECDVSGSMTELFRSGIVEGLFERVLALGLTMDDNGTVPVVAFDTGAKELPDLTAGNRDGYVRTYLQRLVGGGTSYAPAIRSVLDNTTPGDPALVLFFTDGDNGDHREAEEAIREASQFPIFFQFFGIYAGGRAPSFDFLNKLDNLSGRRIDNAGFATLSLDTVTDDALYSAMLKEYPSFLKQARAQGMLPWDPSNDPRQRGRGGQAGFSNAQADLASAARNIGGGLRGLLNKRP